MSSFLLFLSINKPFNILKLIYNVNEPTHHIGVYITFAAGHYTSSVITISMNVITDYSLWFVQTIQTVAYSSLYADICICIMLTSFRL